MHDDSVKAWQQQGTLQLFKLKHRWRGQAWHLSETNTLGWESLRDLLERMLQCETSCARTLQISPLDESWRTAEYPHISPNTWRIEFEPSDQDKELWAWHWENPRLFLRLGRTRLAEFIVCLTNERCEDFGIGGDGKAYAEDPTRAQLWFWRTMMP